jgi:hypothetical protein
MHMFHRWSGLRALVAPLAVVLVGLLAGPAAHAQSVQFLGPFAPGEYPGPQFEAPGPLYEVRVANPRWNGIFGSNDSIIFSKVDTNATWGSNPAVKTSELRWYTSTLAAYINLYAVKAGDVFSEPQVAAGAFPALVPGAVIAEPRSFNLALGSFYLGVQVAVSPEMAGNWQGSMGWLKFQTQLGSQGPQLVMVDSYIGYDASSVVVGQVPESGTMTMALLGMGLVGGLAAARQRAKG